VGHLVNLPRFFEERLGRALAIVMAAPRLGPLRATPHRRGDRLFRLALGFTSF